MAKRFKLATLLNVVGLIIAFALFYLLVTQILYQATYNRQLENHERLYRLDNNFIYKKIWDYNDNVCHCFGEALKPMHDEIESLALFENFSTPYIYNNKNGDKEYEVIYCSPKAISTFANRAINGKIEWDENDMSGLVIPASIAMEYFGTTNVVKYTKDQLGNITEERNTMYCVGVDSLGNRRLIKHSVRGVYLDFPDNSEISNCIYRRIDKEDEEREKYSLNAQYKCYIRFAEVPDDLNSLEIKLKKGILDYINTNSDQFRENTRNLDTELERIKNTNFRFTPLDDSYFQKSTNTSGESGVDIMPFILSLACLFLILVTIINFLNFTLAESPARVRGLNTRLVLGAERQLLRLCIVAECVIVSVVTCIVGIALCQVLPIIHISNMPLTGDLSLPNHWGVALLMLGIAVVVGIVAGTYPAIFATSFAPAKALKGAYGLTNHGRKLRTALVCVQLFVSMLMFIYMGILFLQNLHIFNQPYGFDKNQLLYSNLRYIDPTSAEELESSLRQLPGIESVSFAEILLASTDGHYEVQSTYQGHQTDYYFTHTDQDYMRTMGIKIIEGRDFADDDSAVVIINEAARQQWPWLKMGDKISTDAVIEEADSVTVIGVCENIHYGTMLVNINQPFAFILNRNDDVIFSCLLVRLTDEASLNEVTHRQANGVLQKRYRERVLNRYDSCVAKSYDTELRFFRQMFIIGFACIAITLIGLFCLTMFETEYRRKEIGILKVMGATPREIIGMLGLRYAIYILIAFAIAAPVAGFFGWQTLKSFQQHASITGWLWLFPLALLLVGGTMLGTVLIKSWSTAHENPSSSIKDS